ncbi:helicase HerA-like C-terminal domain-containing protein [Caulobacter sp. ErkDOM-E]|uniref:helicase HerA-like C-terminal domain-containing protein n=1 Tax=Caulobacter sp. ErkDOM-E TaxID=3402778 RepID=UPI003AF49DBB
MTLSIGEGEILIGLGEGPVTQRLDRSNRHGVVAGATGTGKTVTLQIMAQAFSDAGVPVFAADVKGDLSGIALAGTPNEKMLARAASMDLTLTPAAPPTVFWDLFGQKGHPIRTTISEMGPVLLARLLELNDVQEGVLTIVFHVADKDGLLLLDLKDLQAGLKYVADNAADIGTLYGNVSPATVGAIQRKLLTLQSQGADNFFGEPALKLADIMRTDVAGRGYVNLLAADRLIQSPKLYSTFLLWLLSELFEELPELGDVDKPRLVFFFDEAHLLFNDAPKPLLEKIEQVVRLIRSKGVGIYFVTQNPADIPDAVLGQLGARIQHALRAYTPADQKGLKAAAQSFRVNPSFDTAETIQGLGVGEALVSTLDAKGAPCVVQKTMIRPPASRLGPLTPEERTALIARSPVAGLYDTAQDRGSAYEVLQGRAQDALRQTDAAQDAAEAEKVRIAEEKVRAREEARETRAAPRPRASNRQGMAETFAKSLLRTVASQAGREIMRGLLGGLKRGR